MLAWIVKQFSPDRSGRADGDSSGDASRPDAGAAIGRVEPPPEGGRTGTAAGKAIVIDASGAIAHNKRGDMLYAQRAFSAAEASYRLALELAPRFTEAWINLGLALDDQGRHVEAQDSYVKALEQAPDHPLAHFNLGVALSAQGRVSEARACYLRALDNKPGFGAAHFNLAHLANRQGDVVCAREHLERGLAIAPDHEPAVLELVRMLVADGDSGRARQVLARAFENGLDSLPARYFLGNIHNESMEFEPARIEYEYCLERAPDFWQVLLNLGILHIRRHEWTLATARLRQAVAADAGGTQCQLELGHLLLTLGKYREGFELLERRLDSTAEEYGYIVGLLRRFGPGAQWQGEPLLGKKLLVWTEQGLGDSLMMLRFLPQLRAIGAGSLIVRCHPYLLRTVRAMGIADSVGSVEKEAIVHPYDLHCSMWSLPYLLRTSLDTLPDAGPYLRVPDELRQAWARRTSRLPGLKVGLSWAGNPGLMRDALRSMPLSALAPVVGVAGVSFVSLQKNDAARQLSANQFPIVDWMDECKDLLDTAALILNLDLVISVDTCVAHLAGALGQPVWLMNRYETDWRWLIDRSDSPWYAAMRIFRQREVGVWAGVIDEVSAALRRLAQDVR